MIEYSGHCAEHKEPLKASSNAYYHDNASDECN